MKTSIIKRAYEHLYTFIKATILYRNRTMAYYYSNLIESEGIYDAKRLRSVQCNNQYTTNHTIKFRSVHLNKNLFQFIRLLGTPYFKAISKYGSAKQDLFMYKNKFCDFNVRTVVNSLDNVIMSCAYHIEIDSPEKLEQLKAVFQRKYDIENLHSNEFLITDPLENKIYFTYVFKAIITYINGNPLAKEKIDNAITETIKHAELQENDLMGKFKWSF